ncbi:MAG: hypothetical protein ACRDMZ_13370 [Solirubrobacteraceae bacterium]
MLMLGEHETRDAPHAVNDPEPAAEPPWTLEKISEDAKFALGL